MSKPIIATIIGDPAGIGPEVVVKALAEGTPYEVSRPLLIGCTETVEWAVGITGSNFTVRKVTEVEGVGEDSGVIEVYDTGKLDPDDYEVGVESASCGSATAAWLKEGEELATSKLVDAVIMAPINTGSMKMANVLDQIIPPEPGSTYLTLLNGPLRVVHLTDHMPLSKVSGVITQELVYSAIKLVDETFTRWGIPNPRIGVSGFNCHAVGEEDEQEIVPGVERARADGVNVDGPVAPDTVFRRCVDRQYDVVLCMYHDQGHIALKTWKFDGNCATTLGTDYLSMSVAHGTAFDIVGKNIANHEMILNSMVQAASFSVGGGFVE
ncbi:MAG: 4-hydroxythreonine-4-phosphate dehydrogenase PdxA [Gammaproteobacteria bacterium]